MRRLLASALLLALVGGCAPGTDDDFIVENTGPKGAAPVDTASLRAAKKEAGVEPCRPGPGAGPVNGGLPDVTLPCFGGGADVDLATLRGPMVINLWANWCAPCREEMPVLQEFHERYGDRVAILGLNEKETIPDLAMELVVDTGVTYPLIADPEQRLVGKAPFGAINTLPGLVFVAEDGTVGPIVFEEVDDVAEMKALIAEHLGVDL